jgi:uncharacterized protein (TIGR02757 family)
MSIKLAKEIQLIPDTYDGLKYFLDAKVIQYNQPNFITNDPVSIPHLFTKKQDIEIMGFWAATLAWGQRVTIINKCKELIMLMDGAPYDFIINHEEPDLKKLLKFKHRTFNDIDTLYFISFFRYHYEHNESLEPAFIPADGNYSPFRGLGGFRDYFFSLPDFPHRTKKHVSSPSQKSTCKRGHGVDFGIWNHIKPADLIMPCDLHVDRVARKLQLITRKQTDWQTAVELTERLREFDPLDPVKYDFALFGLGIEEKF